MFLGCWNKSYLTHKHVHNIGVPPYQHPTLKLWKLSRNSKIIAKHQVVGSIDNCCKEQLIYKRYPKDKKLSLHQCLK